MKNVTVYGIALQFDLDQVTAGQVKDQVQQAVDEINLTLQRQPFGLGAQIIAYREEMNFTISDDEDEDETFPDFTD